LRRPIHRSRSCWQPICRGPSRRVRWVSSSISKFQLGGWRHTDRGFAHSPKCRRAADSKSAQSLGCEALRFPSALASTPVAFSPLLVAFLDLSVILGAVRLPQTGHRHTLRTHVGFGGHIERPPINHLEARAARGPDKLAVLNKCRVTLPQNPAPQAGLISRRVEPCVDWGTIVGGVEPGVDRAWIGWLDRLSAFFDPVDLPVGLASSRSRIRNVHPPSVAELVGTAPARRHAGSREGETFNCG